MTEITQAGLAITEQHTNHMTIQMYVVSNFKSGVVFVLRLQIFCSNGFETLILGTLEKEIRPSFANLPALQCLLLGDHLPQVKVGIPLQDKQVEVSQENLKTTGFGEVDRIAAENETCVMGRGIEKEYGTEIEIEIGTQFWTEIDLTLGIQEMTIHQGLFLEINDLQHMLTTGLVIPEKERRRPIPIFQPETQTHNIKIHLADGGMEVMRHIFETQGKKVTLGIDRMRMSTGLRLGLIPWTPSSLHRGNYLSHTRTTQYEA
jgi:hypothetical protein